MSGAVSRRSFLGATASGAIALTAASAPGMAAAKPGRYREKHRVDLHAHHLPPA